MASKDINKTVLAIELIITEAGWWVQGGGFYHFPYFYVYAKFSILKHVWDCSQPSILFLPSHSSWTHMVLVCAYDNTLPWQTFLPETPTLSWAMTTLGWIIIPPFRYIFLENIANTYWIFYICQALAFACHPHIHSVKDFMLFPIL